LTYRIQLKNTSIEKLLQTIEKIADANTFIIKKRLLDISVELYQNIRKHSSDSSTGQLIISGKQDSYFIHSINTFAQKDIQSLSEKIDYLNVLDSNQRKEFHTHTLKNSSLTEKGGAGLGLIRIAMRSTSQINYSFKQINSTFCLLSLRVNLSTVA
jgi:hypothetical protein